MTSFSSCGVCIVLLSKLVLRADVMAGSRVVLRRVCRLPARYGFEFSSKSLRRFRW